MQRLIKTGFMGLLLFTLSLAGCSSSSEQIKTPEPPKQETTSNDVSDLNWYVPKFSAINQEGQKVELQDLKGKVWLVDFIFTRCPNICPPMTANMARVQKEMDRQNVQVEIISFSADPEYDQPEILKQFAAKHEANLQNWSFLTGYDLKTVQNIVQTAFKGTITQQKGPSAETPILVNHPSQFYLVDQSGKVRKFYNGLQPDAKQIAQDVKKLDSH